MDKDTNLRSAAEALYPEWERLSEAQQDALLLGARRVKYKKGECVHRGSLDCIGVLLIEKGGLRVYMLSDEGKEITLYRLAEGDMCILSASCVITTITFDVHIDAESELEAILLTPDAYAEVCDENIYAECLSYKILSDRFSDVMWAMQQILFMSFDRRLAVFLWDEIAKSGEDTVSFTHEQIAKYTGSAREVVTRMLNYFSSEGIVELMRGGVKIIDREKLKALTR
ncbi:MAG: Crp/Fnr family transcriptional regulator [Oscillospiraceae bacterium]|nr:Crp/Fnr family transcriptional regulator [Oscillospiraceae bacterium]